MALDFPIGKSGMPAIVPSCRALAKQIATGSKARAIRRLIRASLTIEAWAGSI